MKAKNNKSYFRRYLWIVILSLLVLIAGYIGIYLVFRGNGPFATGIDLTKGDWLAFFGTYLSFAGSFIVSGIAILQGCYYTRLNKREADRKRKQDIQPIFSVKIGVLNTILPGTAEFFNPCNPSDKPQHKNFTLEIENVCAHPIKHVIVFDTYLVQLLKSNDTFSLQGAYEDSPDYASKSKNLLRLVQSEFERTEDGLPKWFNINYEDIDGNEMFQTFELRTFDGTSYYSLKEICEA